MVYILSKCYSVTIITILAYIDCQTLRVPFNTQRLQLGGFDFFLGAGD